MRSLDPQWAGGRPRRITTEQRRLIITTATQRPTSLDMPFTRWSIRKLAQYLATKPGPKVTVSRERLRQILAEEDITITFQRTRDLEGVAGSPPGGEAGPHRVAARARAGPDLCLRRVRADSPSNPKAGRAGRVSQATATSGQLSQAPRDETVVRLVLDRIGPALWTHRTEEEGVPTLRALKAIRAQVGDSEQIYVILDNLNHHKGKALRQWCEDNATELAFTPTYGSWANPI